MGKVLDVTGDGAELVYALQNPSHSVSVISANGRMAPPWRVADELTTAVTLSADGQTLVTGASYADGSIKLGDVATQKLMSSLEGHRSWVSCLKFLPDGRTLASASADRTVRLWDVAARRAIRTLLSHSSELWTFDITPNGRWLAAGSKDGSVILWDLTAADNRPPAYRTLPTSGAEWWYPSPDGRWLSVLQQHRQVLLDTRPRLVVSRDHHRRRWLGRFRRGRETRPSNEGCLHGPRTVPAAPRRWPPRGEGSSARPPRVPPEICANDPARASGTRR